MYKVNLIVQDATYQKLLSVTERMKQGDKANLSREYGDAVTQMACEILRYVFAVMTIDNEYTKGSGAETQKVMDQVTQQLQKYMPWSVSLFSNERLLPVANYLMGQFSQKDGKMYLQYPLASSTAQKAKQDAEAIMQGDQSRIFSGFQDVISIINTGIDELIQKPKDMLKFNIVADKTLNGVIKMLTGLGNKRIESTGKHAHILTAQQCMPHFMNLISEE